MPDYKSPGVYIEEVNNGTKPIEAVSTAVAAFIGFTDKAYREYIDPTDKDKRRILYEDLHGKPTLVTNWSQYVHLFGDFIADAYLPDAVFGYFNNGGSRCYIISLRSQKAIPNKDKPVQQLEATAAQALIPSGDEARTNLLTFTARETGPAGNNIKVEIKPGNQDAPSTFTLIVNVDGRAAETYEGVSLAKGPNDVAAQVKTKSRLIDVKVVPNARADIVPATGTYDLIGGESKSGTMTTSITMKDYQGDPEKNTGISGLERIEDVTMIAVPDLYSGFKDKEGRIDYKGVQSVQQAIMDYCDNIKYCFAILDAPPGLTPQKMKQWRDEVNYDSSRAALYYPWIEIGDMTGSNGRTRTVPPSGHIAGVYARNDETRGVHKAPANEVVRGALGLEIQVTKAEQDTLNPIGVNCVRAFPGRGIRVWGARTLSSDASWRYINVRRLFSMIEESIERGTQWVVFEPNDQNLWARVRRDITAFLRLVWRTGALFGETPDKAFYVKCDEETNPRETRDVGQLWVEVGLAPVKPAEFVIFRVSQWAGPDAEEG